VVYEKYSITQDKEIMGDRTEILFKVALNTITHNP
jgi:hypothetical protein